MLRHWWGHILLNSDLASRPGHLQNISPVMSQNFQLGIITHHRGLRYFHDVREGSDLTMGHPLLVALRLQLPLFSTLQSARLCSPFYSHFSALVWVRSWSWWNVMARRRDDTSVGAPTRVRDNSKGQRVTHWLWRDIRVSHQGPGTLWLSHLHSIVDIHIWSCHHGVKLTTSRKWFPLPPTIPAVTFRTVALSALSFSTLQLQSVYAGKCVCVCIGEIPLFFAVNKWSLSWDKW